jgi:hypothetical protein
MSKKHTPLADIVKKKLAAGDDKPFLHECNRQDAEWGLSTSPDNRPITKQDVVSQALDIVEEVFTENNDMILYDKKGQKRNGHHRMLALITADNLKPGVTIMAWIRVGVDDSIIANIDRGRKRTMSDQANWSDSLAGMTPRRQGVLKSAVLLGYNVAQPSSSTNWWTRPYQVYKPALEWVDKLFPRSVERITTAPVLSVFARAFFTADKTKLAQLAHCLVENGTWPKGTPDRPENKSALVLRDFLLRTGHRTAQGGRPRREVYIITQDMIHAFLTGRVRRDVRLKKLQDLFPTPFPTPKPLRITVPEIHCPTTA